MPLLNMTPQYDKSRTCRLCARKFLFPLRGEGAGGRQRICRDCRFAKPQHENYLGHGPEELYSSNGGTQGCRRK
jgi:hypothetical protein